MLRWVLVALAVTSASLAGVIELGTFASAQAAPPPVVVVATVPPVPTPLPRLVLPREEFAEQSVADAQHVSDGIPGAATTAQSAMLASYGIVTVSYDEHDHANSAALIATPHGVVLAHEGQAVDGVRVIGISEKGVVFDGGIFVPVGYSQQGANPSVPAIGGSLPSQQVPVSVSALPSPSPTPLSVPAPAGVPIHSATYNPLSPGPTHTLAPLMGATPRPMTVINPFNPAATPNP